MRKVLLIAFLFPTVVQAQGVVLDETYPYSGIACTTEGAIENVVKAIAEARSQHLEEKYERFRQEGVCENLERAPVTFKSEGLTYPWGSRMITIYWGTLADKTDKMGRFVLIMWQRPAFECVPQSRDGVCS